jgi:hypothetical protein
MAIPPDSLQPAHDKLRDIWHNIAAEEERVQELIRNTPDPVFDGGDPDPVREEMIRTFEIVRAHRRFTRSCIDYLSWGESVEKLPHFSDKTKAERAIEAAVDFDKAIDSAHSDLTSRLYDLCHNRDNYNSAALAEDIKAILRNFTYSFHSARADLRKGTR